MAVLVRSKRCPIMLRYQVDLPETELKCAVRLNKNRVLQQYLELTF